MTQAQSRGPSEHLTWVELACHDIEKTGYPAQWRSTRAVSLAAAFEQLRTAVGLPLTVLSAYRTPAHNKAIGGARFSQHMEGRALDLRPPPGWTPELLSHLAAEIPMIHGIGIYETGQFLHIDVRPGRRAFWRGGRPQADLEALR